MRESDEFRQTMRRGSKSVQPDLVVHLADATTPTDTSSVGFVVSKAIGNAVVRNRVKRKFRHIMAEELESFGLGKRIVVRALPSSSGRGFCTLQEQVHRGLETAARKNRS